MLGEIDGEIKGSCVIICLHNFVIKKKSMKKLLFILLSMMSVSAALRAGNEIRTTDPQKLPATAREFIATHFPDTRIALIKIDREGGRTDSYDVLLENGSDLEFDRRGQWTEIDAERTTVPQSIIPLRIADYLKRNYPDRPVVKIDRDRRGYGIELSDGTDLEFNVRGDFLRIDY